MPDVILGANGDGSGLASDTRTVTVTVRNDISDATVEAIVKPLRAGTSNFVVGNLADLQRMGAAAVAKGGQNDVFKVNPNVDADEAKAGAQRTLDEEKETAELAATAAEAASATDAEKSDRGRAALKVDAKK